MSSRKVPRTVVPDTIEGVAGLLVARKWDKAAIVYAWTKPDRPGPGVRAKNSLNSYAIAEFADLGIAGLTNRHTVAAYRDAWVWAISEGKAEPLGPGDEIDLDLLFEEKFPPTGRPAYPQTEHDAEYGAEATKAGVSKDAAQRAGSNKAAAKAAYKADPEFRKAVNAAREERIQEMASKTRARREVIDPQPAASTPIDESVSRMDGVVEEAGRRDALLDLLRLAEQIHEKTDQWAERYGYTGVADEVEQVHQISHHLTEAQWRITSFAVDQEEGAR